MSSVWFACPASKYGRFRRDTIAGFASAMFKCDFVQSQMGIEGRSHCWLVDNVLYDGSWPSSQKQLDWYAERHGAIHYWCQSSWGEGCWDVGYCQSFPGSCEPLLLEMMVYRAVGWDKIFDMYILSIRPFFSCPLPNTLVEPRTMASERVLSQGIIWILLLNNWGMGDLGFRMKVI